MPSISIKGEKIPESPIRKLVPYADLAKAKGRKVYHLNIGQPDIATPAIAMDKLRNIDAKVLEYTHSAGTITYRRKIVEYYKSFGVDITVDDIIVTTGASEAILFGMMACLNPGDEIITPEPFYANINGYAIEAGVNIVPITSYIENGFALPPISEFEKKITTNTKAIMICNPNNPTGYLYSKKELEILKNIAKKYDLYLFVDEVYREFCYDGKKHYSILHFDDIKDNIIVIDSISKRYSACGVRVGFIISRNKRVMDAVLKFAQARLSSPLLGQLIGEASIDVPKQYILDILNEYEKRRNIVVDAINKMDGAFCPNPPGAFYTIAQLPIDDADIFCKWLLEDFEYNNETVMFAPASGFYSTKGCGINQVRISYVLNTTDLTTAMICLSEALKIYPGKTI